MADERRWDIGQIFLSLSWSIFTGIQKPSLDAPLAGSGGVACDVGTMAVIARS